ncbi:MAG: tetratricopeptide repeat protein [Chloroherpetonaceae bacterium]|nr:tetratricopeptide repeat protein [Chthonomonadaceae bacterium]MDW8207570.1 tetratricopeptide repeat protein [Chloroherpetonaceae bacterium]
MSETASNRREEVTRLLAQCQQLCAEGRYAEALQHSQDALTLDRQNDDACFLQGLTLFLLGRLEEADAVIGTLLDRRPDYPNAAYLRAGMLRKRAGDHAPEVLAAYDRTLAVDPDNRFALCERADVLRAQGRYAEARDIYMQLTSPEFCPDEALRTEATFNLGCVAMVLQDNETARKAFRAVLDADPDYPDARSLLALVE